MWIDESEKKETGVKVLEWKTSTAKRCIVLKILALKFELVHKSGKS